MLLHYTAIAVPVFFFESVVKHSRNMINFCFQKNRLCVCMCAFVRLCACVLHCLCRTGHSSGPDTEASEKTSFYSSANFSRSEEFSSTGFQTGSFPELLSDAGSCDAPPETSAGPNKVLLHQINGDS